MLKRLEAGENVFRRLDENYGVIDSLIVQAAKQRGLIYRALPPKSTGAKRKKAAAKPIQQTSADIYNQATSPAASDLQPPSEAVDSDVAALAASALCQLSSLSS